jgi:hypothetical protein
VSNVAHELGLDDGEPLNIEQMQEETIAPPSAESNFLPSMPEQVQSEQSEPEPESEPEPVEADAEVAEDRQESPAQKRIRQEIDRRKELQSQVDRQRDQMATMEQRFQTLVERMNPQQPPEFEPEVPEFDEDPAAHLLAQQQRLQDQVAQQNDYLAHQHAEQKQQAQLAQIVNTYTPMEAQFAAQHEDYYPRVEALKSQRLQMYRAMNKTAAEANALVMNEALSLIQQSLAAGANPAQVIYEHATTAPAPASSPSAAPQSAPRSPTSIGSRGSSPKAMTAADLATMSDEEFDRVTSGENWRRLMNG